MVEINPPYYHKGASGPLSETELDTDFNKFTPQEFIFESLEKEFTDDPEALALNVTLLLGLAARVSDVSDIHGEDEVRLLGTPSQRIYTSLLEKIKDAGQSRDQDTHQDVIFASLFDKLAQKFIQRSPADAHQLEAGEMNGLFVAELESAIQIRRNRYEEGVILDVSSRNKLRQLKKDILELSEDHFIEATKQFADQAMPINTSRFNNELVYLFCDRDYWQHYCDSVSLADTLGDLAERNRLERIGRSHLRWIKDQSSHIKYANNLNGDSWHS